MQVRKHYFINAERGVSLSGLIAVLVVLGVVAVFAMKVVPSYGEYRSIKGAIVKAKSTGGSVAEMKRSFDKNAEINAISAITSHDLVFSKDNGETDISFGYEKRMPLVANVSLVIDYAGTTAANGVATAKAATTAE
jgi:Tfp pilus assembly protein PilE